MASLMALGAAGSAAAGTAVAKTLTIVGTAMSAVAGVKAGNQARAAADFEAKQLEADGKTALAMSTVASRRERLETDLLISRARAVGAASGGGQDYTLMGEIAEEGDERALTSIWEGEESRRGRNTQAAARKVEGQSRRAAGRVGAFRTIANGGVSFLEKYS